MGMTIDGIHYQITEPRPFSTDYSSHKFGGKACLDYEFGIYTHKPQLAWINGPIPSGTPDINVFKSKLWHAIRAKQATRSNTFRAIADDGYMSKELQDVLVFRNEMDPPELAYFKDRALARHETFNGMTKRYACMTKLFHHDRGQNPERKHPRHKTCLEAICVTIQVELNLGVETLLDPYPT